MTSTPPLRSPLERSHRASGATFKAVNDSIIVSHFDSPAAEINQAKSLAIADLCALPRTGYKSRHAPQWLQNQEVILPDKPNQCVAQPDGSLVASLSNDEHLILSALDGQATGIETLDADWHQQDDHLCYQLPRAHSHTWLAISGQHAAAMLAKLCGVDLREKVFAEGRVAQTSVARLSAIVIRPPAAKTDLFYLLADAASSDYLWMCLVDAMQEWKGKAVGVDAIEAQL